MFPKAFVEGKVVAVEAGAGYAIISCSPHFEWLWIPVFFNFLPIVALLMRSLTAMLTCVYEDKYLIFT